jgi:hypothetical protein
MAGTTTKSRDNAGHEQGALRDMLLNFQKVVTDLETLRAAVGGLVGSATYDPGSLNDGAGATTTVTVTGAALGDFVTGVSFSLDLQGITVTGWVSSSNTVSVRFQNESGGTLDLASGTLRVRVSAAGTLTGAAADMTAAKVGNESGTPITV